MRARTHQAVVRDLTAKHERERGRLLSIIEEQNNRLMFMVGRPWELPDVAEPEPLPLEPEDDIDYTPEAEYVDLAG